MVFSPFGLQGSVDYTITEAGISCLTHSQVSLERSAHAPQPPSPGLERDEVPPSDDDLEYSYRVLQRTGALRSDRLEDEYWDDFDDIPDVVLQDV